MTAGASLHCRILLIFLRRQIEAAEELLFGARFLHRWRLNLDLIQLLVQLEWRRLCIYLRRVPDLLERLGRGAQMLDRRHRGRHVTLEGHLLRRGRFLH